MRCPFHRSVNRNNLFIGFAFWQLRCFFFSRDANTSVVASQIQAKESVEVEASDQEPEISLHGISSYCCDNNFLTLLRPLIAFRPLFRAFCSSSNKIGF